jgi:multidrug efflux pump subunit AcrA (membrane-fusion protein)
LLVPAKAVLFQAGEHFVFIDNGGGKYMRRHVQTGDVRQDRVEILEGLRDGEKVVTEGSLMLQQTLRPARVQK